MTKPKAAREDRFKRRVYPIPPPGSNEIIELPSVSRLEDVLYSYNLEEWKFKTIATEIAKRKDLIILAATDPKKAYKDALDSGQKAANVGSSVHSLSEQYEEGILDWELVNQEAEPWLRSYIMAKETFGWTVAYQEETIYNFTLKYAGTADRIIDLPGYGLVIMDIKTGRGVYGSSSAQLSLYANGEGIWQPPADCPKARALYKELDENISSGENVPEGRRGWSKAAQDFETAKIDELYWQEYAELGTHLPMPEGLRTDIAFLLHVYDKDYETRQPRPADLIPLRLDKGLSEAVSFLFHWDQDRTIVGKPLPHSSAAKEEVAEKETVDELVRKDAEAEEEFARNEQVDVFQIRADDLAIRAKALPKQLQKALKEQWPKGTPMLSSGDCMKEDLDIIEELIQEQEGLVLIKEAFPGAAFV